MHQQKVAPGEVVFLEGQEGRNAYRVLSGKIQIYITRNGGEITLNELSSGEIFGEMGMIQERPRSASARAMEDSELEVLTDYDFNHLILTDPAKMVPYLSSFFERLRHANEIIASRAASDPQPPPQVAVEHERPPIVKIRRVSGGDGPADDFLAVHKFPFRIGRAGDPGAYDVLFPNDLKVDDSEPYEVSRNQCVLERFGSAISVRDRGSKRGTIVNGEPIGSHVSGKVSAELQRGENELILGSAASRHRFAVTVE